MSGGGVPIRVYLLVEHPALRRNLELLLAEEGMTVCGSSGEAGGLGAVPAATDAVVVALSGVEGSGLDLLRELHARPDGPLGIALSANDDALFIREVIEAGAQAFVSNREASETLADVIRRLVAGQMVVPRSKG